MIRQLVDNTALRRIHIEFPTGRDSDEIGNKIEDFIEAGHVYYGLASGLKTRPGISFKLFLAEEAYADQLLTEIGFLP